MMFQGEVVFRKEQVQSKNVRVAALLCPTSVLNVLFPLTGPVVHCSSQLSARGSHPEHVPVFRNCQPLARCCLWVSLVCLSYHCYLSTGCQRACDLLDVFFPVNFGNTEVTFLYIELVSLQFCFPQGGLSAGSAGVRPGALSMFGSRSSAIWLVVIVHMFGQVVVLGFLNLSFWICVFFGIFYSCSTLVRINILNRHFVQSVSSQNFREVFLNVLSGDSLALVFFLCQDNQSASALTIHPVGQSSQTKTMMAAPALVPVRPALCTVLSPWLLLSCMLYVEGQVPFVFRSHGTDFDTIEWSSGGTFSWDSISRSIFLWNRTIVKLLTQSFITVFKTETQGCGELLSFHPGGAGGQRPVRPAGWKYRRSG